MADEAGKVESKKKGVQWQEVEEIVGDAAFSSGLQLNPLPESPLPKSGDKVKGKCCLQSCLLDGTAGEGLSSPITPCPRALTLAGLFACII